MIFANTVMMIRPARFGYNPETAESNPFQDKGLLDGSYLQEKAIEEFDVFVRTLTEKGIGVIVEDDTDFPIKPDAVFPNNWISFHADGTLVIYPMHAPNRRTEIRMDIVECIKKYWHVQKQIDLSEHAVHNEFLEGTGSIVFDQIGRAHV